MLIYSLNNALLFLYCLYLQNDMGYSVYIHATSAITQYITGRVENVKLNGMYMHNVFLSTITYYMAMVKILEAVFKV